MKNYGVDINLIKSQHTFPEYRLRYISYRHIFDIGDNSVLDGKIDYNDITVVLKGSLKYIINNKAITVNESEMLFMPVGTERYRDIQEGTAEYCSLNFWSDSEEKPNIPDCISCKISLEMNNCIRKICAIYSNRETSIERKCISLLSLFITYAEENFDSASQSETVEQIKRYIIVNWNENPTIATISDVIKYHPVHCCRLFRQYENCSINEYISRIRLNHVSDMLRYSDMNISEVANTSGLSVYYFCRWFHKQTGMTPSEYRENYYSTK